MNNPPNPANIIYRWEPTKVDSPDLLTLFIDANNQNLRDSILGHAKNGKKVTIIFGHEDNVSRADVVTEIWSILCKGMPSLAKIISRETKGTDDFYFITTSFYSMRINPETGCYVGWLDAEIHFVNTAPSRCIISEQQSEVVHLLQVQTKVYKTANNTIYFADNSDYLSALIEICLLIKPDETPGKKYIEKIPEGH